LIQLIDARPGILVAYRFKLIFDATRRQYQASKNYNPDQGTDKYYDMAKQPVTTILISLLLILSLSRQNNLQAQKQEIDALHLKSGNIYRGHMLSTGTPGVIVLETLCSNTLQFKMDEIDHLERETIRMGRRNSFLPRNESGYFNRTDLGALVGTGNNDNNLIFGIQMVNGYQLKSKIYPGLGMGLEFFDQAFMPLFADVVYYMGKSSVAPFVRGSLGYTLPLEDPRQDWGTILDSHGGLMCAVGFGTSIRMSQNNALCISVIYRFQNLRTVQTQDWNDDKVTLDTQYNRLGIRVGFVFD
jgi:hypothetical protein